MRTFLLASSALLLTTGMAFAQNSQMSSPAPTGAVSAPRLTPANGAPGNMAPAPSDTTAMSSLPKSGISQSPNGAASAPNLTSGATPGTAPGKFAQTPTVAPTDASASTGSMAGSMPMHHHHWSSMGGGKLPENASATTYLHIAKSAIKHRNVTLADDALSHAETQLLNRSVPQGQVAADDSAPIQSIESARKALHSGDYSTASSDTKQAASAVSGM